jgi:hypothetical protein
LVVAPTDNASEFGKLPVIGKLLGEGIKKA